MGNNKGQFKKGNVPWNKGKRYSIPKMSDAIKKKWQDPEYANRCRESQRVMWKHNKHPFIGRKHTKEAREKMSRTKKDMFERGELIPWNTGKEHNLWKNPDYARKIAIARRDKPNKPETVMINLLGKMFPDEWKYCGDMSFMIDGKNPDFVNVNGQKKLIEVFGDYWHDQSEVKPRKSHFRQFGFDTLVIWEHELKDLQMVEQKLLEFHQRGR